jgi:hypothetical protein
VVPVAEEVARAATIAAVDAELERDVLDSELLLWVDSQLEMEGPTAREALFLGARDDLRRVPHLELFARIDSVEASTREFSTRMLNNYDPSFDYDSWIKETRTRVASRLIREVDEQLALADALGAHLVTRAPFRARLLRKKQRLTASVPSVTALVEVPALESVDAATLARIAANEEAVDALRRALRRALRDVEEADVAGGVRNVQRLVDDLTEEAVHELRTSMRRSAIWTAAAPGVITLSSLVLGASPLMTTAISVASAVAPYIAARADHRARPAWIFHTGARSARSATRKGRE